MFGQVMFTHVRWTRSGVAVLSVAAFALPALIWRMVHQDFTSTYGALEVMRGFQVLGPLLAALSIFVGVLVVGQAYAADEGNKQVYALSLPVAWSRYVAMRFGAGALLLLAPAVSLWLGTLLVLSLVTIPASLHAYPGTLTLRFLFASFVAYAVTFPLPYLTGKRAAHLLLGVLIGVSVLMFGAELAGMQPLLRAAVRLLFEWPGPLAVFSDSWMLIDV